jgi:hypothetical protein
MVEKRVFIQGKYDTTDIKREIESVPELNWRISKTPTDCDYFISFDKIEIESQNQNILYVLVRNEPQIVLPELYKKRYVKPFNKIIDVGKNPNNELNSIYHPQNLDGYSSKVVRNSERIVILNSNLLSFRKGEHYSLRRKASQEFPFVDVYGYGWDKTFFEKCKIMMVEGKQLLSQLGAVQLRNQINYFKKPLNYKGSVDNKSTALLGYKYALIIENSPTYISEKIFDAFTSGCFPIYIGIDLSLFEIPDNLYFQCEPNLKSIKESYEMLKNIDYQQWQINCSAWLQSSETEAKWSRKNFLINIKNAIEDPFN